MTGPERRVGWGWLADLAAWVPALILATTESYSALSRSTFDRLPDLHAYVASVLGLHDGHSLYAFRSAGGSRFVYPPFAGIIMQPLAVLPRRAVEVAWTAGSAVVVILLALVLAQAVVPTVPARWRRWLPPLCAAVLFVSAPVSSNLRFGQVSVAMVLLPLFDMVNLRRSRWQGVLIGLSAAVKLSPLIFVPVLWFGGRRRAAAVATATFVAVGALAWPILPGDSWHYWSYELWHLNDVGHIAPLADQSLDGLMLRLGLTGAVRVIPGLVAAAVVSVVALWRAAVAYRRGQWLCATVVAGTASVVVSPVAWTHHQTWYVLAAFVPWWSSTRARIAWAATVIFLMTLAVGPQVWHIPGLDGSVLDDLRLTLAIVIACLLPIGRAGSLAADEPRRPWRLIPGRSPPRGGPTQA